jgi:hypothetical protein
LGKSFCFSPEADAHFRDLSAHVNKYFQKTVIFLFFE